MSLQVVNGYGMVIIVHFFHSEHRVHYATRIKLQLSPFSSCLLIYSANSIVYFPIIAFSYVHILTTENAGIIYDVLDMTLEMEILKDLEKINSLVQSGGDLRWLELFRTVIGYGKYFLEALIGQ